MDFFNTIGKVATTTATGLQKSAELGESLNYSTAVFSNDPKKQQIANNRVICSNRFKWKMIETTFYSIFLPIIIFGIIILIGELFKYFEKELSPTFLIPPAILLVGGIIYIGYLSSMKWNIIRNIINTSDDLEPPNKCGF